MSAEPREGLVIYRSSRNVRVAVGREVWLCSIRGRFREQGGGSLPVVVGDRVLFRPTSAGEAVLEEILARRNELRRARAAREQPPGRRAARGRSAGAERVVAANIDRVLVVLAGRSPPPRWGLVDRVLVSSHFEALEVGICLNKWDQVAHDPDEVARLEENLEVYRTLGHAVFRTSILRGDGQRALLDWFQDKLTVLSGHSGVGKSSILNACCPGLGVATKELSQSTGKGRHVTTAVTLYELPEGGYLVDTPGYREYGLHNLDAADLSRHYREFQPHLSRCRFKDCLHIREPGCGVLQAVERGEISRLRYENYLGIVETLEGAP